MHWGEDEGARWYLKPDPDGQYVLEDGVYKAVRGRGSDLRPVSKAHGDGAFRVKKADTGDDDVE